MSNGPVEDSSSIESIGVIGAGQIGNGVAHVRKAAINALSHRLSMSRLTEGFRPYALLILLCLTLYLPGIASVPSLDRDESRFAQASRQMLESGDFIRIQFQSESRAKKPAGIYWLQAAAAWLTGAEDRIWAYRLPSVLGALVAVILTYHFGGILFGRPTALLGSALLASSLILVSEAHQATTDAVLLACAVTAQGVLGRFYVGARLREIGGPPPPGKYLFLLFWIAQGLGVLVKGPLVALITVLTVLALWAADRRIAWLKGLRPMTGLVIMAALVGPWALAISLATQGQFIGQAIHDDMLLKVVSGQESHGFPPGYYLLLLTATFWPASLLAVPGFVGAVRTRRDPAHRFCLAWIIPAWILFEMVPTKLPHYTLLLMPALALLAGAAAMAPDGLFRAVFARLYAGSYVLWSLALAGFLIAAPIWLGDGILMASVITALALMASAAAQALAVIKGKPRTAVLIAVAGACLTYGVLFGALLPRLGSLWLSQRVAAVSPAGAPLCAAGFGEPSLVFLGGTRTLLTDGEGAANCLGREPGAVAVVEAAALPDFTAAMSASGRHAKKFAQVDGFNYSRGRPARLSLWQSAEAPLAVQHNQ
jgi:4-amino-4-deoxy-L-arabinose transferase-like glycosyltransferase